MVNQFSSPLSAGRKLFVCHGIVATRKSMVLQCSTLSRIVSFNVADVAIRRTDRGLCDALNTAYSKSDMTCMGCNNRSIK